MGLVKATRDSSRAEVYPLVFWMQKEDRLIIYHEPGGRWQLLGVYTVLQTPHLQSHFPVTPGSRQATT